MSDNSPETAEIPDLLALLPLRNSVLFPGSIIPIDVGRAKSVALIEDAIAAERPIIGIVAQRDFEVEDPSFEDIYSVGCAARILPRPGGGLRLDLKRADPPFHIPRGVFVNADDGGIPSLTDHSHPFP